ncbi:MAG: ComEA family DNA-binding protein [Eubacteriales bacterium]|nr:ComEA family DNA-binding protein [Eubacteriales bacterium]
MLELKTKELAYLIVLAVLIASLGMCSSLRGRVFSDKSPLAAEAVLIVHVAGAVKSPGVYTLPAGSRIRDAIDAAGGPLPEADIHRLNLADILIDGRKVHVPIMDNNPPEEDGLVNINTADAKELETLPNIGPARAQKIIEYRELHGPFSSIEEITKVSTIGPKIFESIKDLITF